MAIRQERHCRTVLRRAENLRRNPHPIALITDFRDDLAKTECELAIEKTAQTLGIEVPPTKIINDVERFNIVNGAFQIARVAHGALPNTVIVGVVDPGVGTKREGIVITTDNNLTFVGPNNGLLYPAASAEGIKKVFIIDEDLFPHTNTFHGRDIFSPVATHIAARRNPSTIAGEVNPSRLVELHFQQGQIVHVDQYGNLKVFSDTPKNTGALLTLNDSITIPFGRTFADVSQGALIAYLGSSGLLEIAVREGNAGTVLNARPGDSLNINWIPAISQ